MKKEQKIGFMHSLSTKIAIVVFVCVIFSGVIAALLCLTKMEGLTGKLVENYAQTISEDAARSIDGAELGGVELNSEVAQTMIGNAGIIGIESSYVYICDDSGIMLYHPTASKIGSMVENDAIRSVVDRVKRGEKVSSGSIVYDYQGDKKLAGYALTANNEIVVTTADYSEAMKEVATTTEEVCILLVICLVVMTIAGLAVCKFFLSGVNKILAVVEETAQFDFRTSANNEKLIKRRDEIGVIARALSEMRNNLRGIVNQITSTADLLNDNIDELKSGSRNVHTMCADNSATTEELAAGMQETSATAETINSNIEAMLENAKGIDSLAEDGGVLSVDISERAKALKQSTVEATEKTQQMYVSVKEKADQAILNAQVVSKINEMTKQIMQISSQTSLLALNASIESARAGENGRGFAVVASEIGNLASQTSSTVADIDKMVGEVIAAVKQMEECLAETTDFIGEKVIEDYKEFEHISEQYNADADKVRSSMESIREGVEGLNATIGNVAYSVAGISTTVEESTVGVNGIAETTSNIVVLTDDTVAKAGECKEEIVSLEDIVSRFVLD